MKIIIFFASVLALAAANSARGRIFHGVSAKDHMFPYQVGIELQTTEDESWCSGVLIGDTWVLTAAHCFENSTDANITVYLGGIYRQQSVYTFRIKNDDVIVHGAWDANTVANDIALIRIPQVQYSKVVKPASLPSVTSRHEPLENHVAFFPGWGYGGDSGYLALELQWASFKIISNTKCKTFYPGDEIWNQDICALGDDKAATCAGDSGGGLIDLESRNVVGIASSGPLQSCEKEKPAIFTRVTYFREWISSKTEI